MPERLPPNLVRFAIPCNVYHKEHMDYVIEALDRLNKEKEKIKGFKIVRGKDLELRHFLVGLRPKE